MPETTREDTRTKRRAILDAAAELFARQGYENTTIADIARAAGMAVGTVYLYFHNKHEIYNSVSIDWVEAIATVLQDPAILALPIRQVPRAVIEASFRICHDNRELMPLFQVDVQSAEEIWQHKLAEGSITKALDAFLRQAIEQGQLAPFDTEMYAKILFGMVHSVLYECYCIEHGENEELYRERTIEVVERLFFGPSLIVESEQSSQ
ncbi:MAG TPA: TetR/AcrR family transcriptional regulator [Ktedonobacteraceae bacterium]|nr:TetR/AcrR family transcriptional regulator [Ktedonobacteraceae bacterium]